MTYKNAPISEVIMGISYDKNKIPVNDFLNNAVLSNEFPLFELFPPISLELLNGFQIQQNFVPVPYLIRRWSNDKKWLLQIQENMFFLNWIRNDTEPVGHYGGFSSIKNKFFSIMTNIEDTSKINLRNDISLLDLTYHDRVKWQSEISDLSEIDKIMNIKSPPKFSNDGYNNIFSRHTFHDSELNGFGFININTDTANVNEQLIKIELNLRGRSNFDDNIEDWFEQAHLKQFNIFEQLFTNEMKEKWL